MVSFVHNAVVKEMKGGFFFLGDVWVKYLVGVRWIGAGKVDFCLLGGIVFYGLKQSKKKYSTSSGLVALFVRPSLKVQCKKFRLPSQSFPLILDLLRL